MSGLYFIYSIQVTYFDLMLHEMKSTSLNYLKFSFSNILTKNTL